MHKESEIRDPLILGNKSYHDISKDVARPIEGKANKYWWILFSLSLGAAPKQRGSKTYMCCTFRNCCFIVVAHPH